jgi:hypothetical protein
MDKVKAFGWFLGYLLIAKVVVKPLATQFNVPYLKDI